MKPKPLLYQPIKIPKLSGRIVRQGLGIAPAPKRSKAPKVPSKGEALLLAQIERLGLPTPVLEHRFLLHRRYRFDFAWPDRKLAVEVEGGTWVDGRHSRGAGFEADCEKYALAVLAGWRVIRATTGQVRNGKALKWIEAAL